MAKKNWLFPALLILLWVLLAMVVNPVGNFPLNDDWQYARPVEYLVHNGYYFSRDFYSPILIAQVLWGALCSLIFGFSHTTLRFSVLFIGIAGLLALYFFVARLTKNKPLAFLVTLVMLVNPLYFISSNSFMTDVPFLVTTLVSIFFYFRSLESAENNLRYILLGTLFAIIATLIRQFGVVIPLAFGIVAFAKHKPSFKKWPLYILPAVLAVVFLKLGMWWLKHIGSPLQPFQGHDIIKDYLGHPGRVVTQFFERTGYALYYAGLMLSPVILLVWKKLFMPLPKKQKLYAVLFTLVFVPILIADWPKLPCGNLVSDIGVGIITIKGGNLFPLYSHSSPALNAVIGIAFVFALFLLLSIGVVLIQLLKEFKSSSLQTLSWQKIFILICMFGYALLLFLPDFFFDRYLLLFMPMFLLLLIPADAVQLKLKPLFSGIAFVILLVIGGYSATVTHDYLAWNRARWQALSHLKTDMNISPYEIDGGYEFNGWYIGVYFPDRKDKSWWFVYDDEYMVTMGKVDGYKVIGLYPYQNYFPYEARNIYVLQRQ